MGRSRGLSVIELLGALALGSILLTLGYGGLTAIVRSTEMAAAAREMATTFRALQWISVKEHRYVGLWFETTPDGWSWWRVGDGNGNGLRASEIRDGTDPRLSGPHHWRRRGNRTQLALPRVRVRRIPPRRGWMTPPSDPIRFGASNLISFAPDGSSSSGTIFLSDGRNEFAAIVLFGATGRVRVWRWNVRQEQWQR